MRAPVSWFTMFLIVGGVLLSSEVSGSSCTGGTVNGCTTLVKLPYKSHFTPSCNRHDVCYDCGSKFGKSRYRCDADFKSNLRKSCSNSCCNFWANSYYKAVRVFGIFFYKSTPRSYCNEPWVNACV